MGKVLQFKPQQPGLRLLPRADVQACRKCGHPLAMHVVHPNGILECLTTPLPVPHSRLKQIMW